MPQHTDTPGKAYEARKQRIARLLAKGVVALTVGQNGSATSTFPHDTVRRDQDVDEIQNTENSQTP